MPSKKSRGTGSRRARQVGREAAGILAHLEVRRPDTGPAVSARRRSRELEKGCTHHQEREADGPDQLRLLGLCLASPRIP